MNNIINGICRWGLPALLLVSGACACDEWTETESLKQEYATVQDQNPGLWNAYLQSLRNYRQSDHKILVAGFDNNPGVPSGRGELLGALPDSTDFAVLSNPDNLTDAVVADMGTIKEEKGIKTLYTVSYENMLASYDAYLAAWKAEHPDPESGGETAGADEPSGDAVPAEEALTRSEFIAGELADSLALYDKYGYDGIVVSFTGTSTLKLSDEEKNAERLLQDEFFIPLKEWKSSRADAVLMFSGKPRNLLSEDFLSLCDYIVIPAETASSAYELSFRVRSSMDSGIPSDRFIACVSAPYGKLGMFSGNVTAIEGAADWAVSEDGTYSRAGIMVMHAQKDYFNSVAYGNIRRAISIMNPTPKFQ